MSGGTAAGKTIGILLYLIDLAQSDEKPTLTSIVSESFPHLKRGVMRDFLNIMEECRRFKDERWNKTDYIYTFGTGSKIEFFSADQPGKVRGPRRQRLFLNEANNISHEVFDQLEVRTEEFIFIDYNPISEFWAYTELIGKRDDVDFITLTYKDNEALNEDIVRTIEQRKNKTGWWKIYGLGELGESEQKIYKGWQIVDELPHEARLERYWLDFGYTNDETAIGAIYYYNGGYILDEVCYQKELSNKQIADILKNVKPALTIADSAEPKSIAEIKSYGVNILPCEKGPDSVRQGIQLVQEQQISVTKQSVNVIKEYHNYLWETDRDGKVINIPQGIWDHHMSGIRYVFSSLVPLKRRQEFIRSLPRPVFRAKVNPAE